MPSPERADIGAYTLPGNRYGSLNQDHVVGGVAEGRAGGGGGAVDACAPGAAATPGVRRPGHAACSGPVTPYRLARARMRAASQEVWRAAGADGDAPRPGGDANRDGAANGNGAVAAAAAHGGLPELLIGAVLDGHGILGEAAARRGGAAVVRELRRLVAEWGERCSGEGCNGDHSHKEPALRVGSSCGSGSGGSGGGSGSSADEARTASSSPRGAPPPAAAPAAGSPPPPRRPLAAIPPPDVEALVEAAFARAHASALALYDDPPRVACYPDARTGAASVYCLQSRDGPPVYAAPPGARGPAPTRPLECGATCTVALLQGRRLVVGNVGDSSAVLGRCVHGRRARAGRLHFI
jgi:hypothetical protein